MGLSRDLIMQFVKATKDKDDAKKETTVYGTIIESNGSQYVQLDGSELFTPISKTSDVRDGDRVTVLIKNHTAVVTGNLSSPSARVVDVQLIGDDVTAFNTILADKVDTVVFEAERARIDTLQADNVIINSTLTAQRADIDSLTANYGDFQAIATERLDAVEANIDSLDVTYANIDFSNIGKTAMEYFYSVSGLIDNVVVGDQTITGELVGVTINGDRLIGNTVIAEKLVIKGSDGLYYKLNTDGMTTEAQQTDENSLNGQIIKAKSITATKISVSDLVAFGATIGGFTITQNSLYSGVKSAVGNTTRGIFLGNDGQFSVGDASNFLKYYKDTDGSYKLAISAKSVSISGGADIETAINDLQNGVDGIEIGGRNLLSGMKDLSGFYPSQATPTTTIVEGADGYSYANFPVATSISYRAISSTYGAIPPKVVLNRQVVFSFEMRSDTAWTASGTNLIIGFALCNSSSTTRLKYRTVYLTGDIETSWTRFEVKATLTEDFFTHGDGKIEDCTRFYMQIYNYSINHLQIRKPKLEYGTKATDWTPSVEDVEGDISDASKTASNFLSYDSSNGLQIGNKATGSWSGFRSQITNTAFRILNSAGTVLSSYGEKLIELGKNATDAIIKLCGGKGTIEYTSDYILQLSADSVRVRGTEESSLYANYTDGNGIFRNGAVHSSPGEVLITASGGSDNSTVVVKPTNIQMAAANFYLSGTMNDSKNGGEFVSVSKGTSGIWTFKQYANGDLEMWGSYPISNRECTTAMGNLYRTAVFSPNAFPFTVYSPVVTASYESDGYGAFLWATTKATTTKPPNYYLVRPTSTTIASGVIHFHVLGKWKT